eukprot:4699700-Pleurochrysis_carterae.AAC.1
MEIAMKPEISSRLRDQLLRASVLKRGRMELVDQMRAGCLADEQPDLSGAREGARSAVRCSHAFVLQ